MIVEKKTSHEFTSLLRVNVSSIHWDFRQMIVFDVSVVLRPQIIKMTSKRFALFFQRMPQIAVCLQFLILIRQRQQTVKNVNVLLTII